MNNLKIINKLQKIISEKPYEYQAVSDLFEMARIVEQDDPKLARSINKDLRNLIPQQVRNVKNEYVVRGKKYYKELYFESFGKFNIDYPLKIKVYYNSKNPKNAVTQYELTPSSYEGILSCLIGIYVLKIVYRLLGG